MCDWVAVKDLDGHEIVGDVTDVAELRTYLPTIVVKEPMWGRYRGERPLTEDECLCWVDVPASALASGFTYEGFDGIVLCHNCNSAIA
jgi:hypothetical protein